MRRFPVFKRQMLDGVGNRIAHAGAPDAHDLSDDGRETDPGHVQDIWAVEAVFAEKDKQIAARVAFFERDADSVPLVQANGVDVAGG